MAEAMQMQHWNRLATAAPSIALFQTTAALSH